MGGIGIGIGIGIGSVRRGKRQQTAAQRKREVKGAMIGALKKVQPPLHHRAEGKAQTLLSTASLAFALAIAIVCCSVHALQSVW